jgi:Ca2+-binding EF-hand superfamily protein
MLMEYFRRWTTTVRFEAHRRDSGLIRQAAEPLIVETHLSPWSRKAAQLPMGNSAEQQAARKQLFRLWDPNGNGKLSLREVVKGLGDAIGHVKMVVPAVNRAFHAARRLEFEQAKESQNLSDDFVEYKEFRALLVYVSYYLDLWDLFARADTSGDRRMSFNEFQEIVSWLVARSTDDTTHLTTDPKATFDRMDHDGGGSIFFDEFAHWALCEGIGRVEDENEAHKKDAIRILRSQSQLAATLPAKPAKAKAKAKEIGSSAASPTSGSDS